MQPSPDELTEESAFAAGALGVAVEKLTDTEREAVLAELATAEENAKAERDSRLEALAVVLTGFRTEAVTGRMNSGIEDDWTEDEEAYEGYDDANRAEEAAGRLRKPVADGGSIGSVKATDNRSTVFLNITRPYVDSAAARIGDMLLPTDDRAWQFKPTPISDQPGNKPQEQQPQPGQPPSKKTPIQASIDAAMVEARRKVENAQRRVDDWLTECQWHANVRLVIDDSARLGTGVFKGPVPTTRKRTSWKDGALQVTHEVVPESKRVDPWDAFPDPACGENIHKGRFFFERDRMTKKQVGDLRVQMREVTDPVTGEKAQVPMYLVDQLEAVLLEGPSKHTNEGRIDLPRDLNIEKAQYEVWYCYATLERADLEVLDCDCPQGTETMVPVMAMLINDRVVRVVVNPLDTGAFPYDFLPWQRRKGMPWGRGVARQVRVPQRMLNAANRNMMDNAALSAGLILFLRRKGLTPADGNWNLHGRKVFFIDDSETDLKEAKDSITTAEIPSRQAELMNIINFALKMAEDVTGLPMLLQGQEGKSAPQTLGGQQIAMNNANGVLRRLAKMFDDYITEPHITRYYDWLQQYSEDPEEQCDAVIDARGSSALVERDIQNQAVLGMGAYVKDPAFEINPAKWAKEAMKAQRLDPERFRYTKEELEALKQQPPPTPYQVDVAKINAEARIREAVLTLMGEESLSLNELKARLTEVVTQDRRERDLFTAEAVLARDTGSGI